MAGRARPDDGKPVLDSSRDRDGWVSPQELKAMIDAGDTAVIDAGPGLSPIARHTSPARSGDAGPSSATAVAKLGKIHAHRAGLADGVRARLASLDLADLTDARVAVLGAALTPG